MTSHNPSAQAASPAPTTEISASTTLFCSSVRGQIPERVRQVIADVTCTDPEVRTSTYNLLERQTYDQNQLAVEFRRHLLSQLYREITTEAAGASPEQPFPDRGILLGIIIQQEMTPAVVAELSSAERITWSLYANEQLQFVHRRGVLEQADIDHASHGLQVLRTAAFGQPRSLEIPQVVIEVIAGRVCALLRDGRAHFGDSFGEVTEDELNYLDGLVSFAHQLATRAGGGEQLCVELQKFFHKVHRFCLDKVADFEGADAQNPYAAVSGYQDQGQDEEDDDEQSEEPQDSAAFEYGDRFIVLHNSLRDAIIESQLGRSNLPFWHELLQEKCGTKDWGFNIIELARIDSSEISGYLPQLIECAARTKDSNHEIAVATLVNLMCEPETMGEIEQAFWEVAPNTARVVLNEAHELCLDEMRFVSSPNIGRHKTYEMRRRVLGADE